MPAVKKTKADPISWGRLSESLTGPKHPHRCQRCGRHRAEIEAVGAYLQAWLECDCFDQPEDIVVMLCTLCDKESTSETGRRQRGIIARHERLYKELQQDEPYPGILDLCVHCSWRDRTRGTFCAHPDRKRNGGEGTLYIQFGASASIHISCRPRALSGFYRSYGPATSCSGREEEDVVEDLLHAESGCVSTLMNETHPALTDEQQMELMDFE